ncbi:MAG: trypsin-like serine protease [Myxococcales bacterium]|nr:trypsin-like serine protease [Myxococcales bacterium]
MQALSRNAENDGNRAASNAGEEVAHSLEDELHAHFPKKLFSLEPLTRTLPAALQQPVQSVDKAAARSEACPVRHLFLSLFLLVVPLPAVALVVDGSSAETRRAPKDDPGWASVGQRGISSAVYLRDGWVITAAHAGTGDVIFSDTTHTPVPGTTVQLSGSGGASPDLMMFRITPTPDLPELRMNHKPMRFGTRVVMIGFGKGTGQAFEWDGIPGYRWSPDVAKRWGTNRVFAARQLVSIRGLKTWCFQMDFSRHGTAHEAQAAFGDSGGAVFVKQNDRWKLTGVILHVGKTPDQPGATSIYGNITNAADLSFYRSQIIKTIRTYAAQTAP